MGNTFIKIACVLAVLLTSALSVTAADAPPNVILVVVDDLGWMDLGCQGSKYYETPNIDSLAADGMRFTNGYAACAVCSPSRAANMTGLYPARTGVTDWIRATFQRDGRNYTEKDRPPPYQTKSNAELLCPNNPFWLEHEYITIAEALKPRGFVTCHIGKWHLGDRDWYPPKQGFDFNYGGCDYGQPPSYYDPFKGGRKGREFDIPSLPGRKPGQYLTDREGEEAVGFIEHAVEAKKPFFLHLATYAVHTPIQAKKSLLEKYENKPKHGQKSAAYATMVESVDQAVGEVLKTLDRLDVADNTLIIFTSDNGGLGRFTNNAPLRGQKGDPYEGGIRVPFIVKWPGKVNPGGVSDEPVIGCDLFPSIMQATGTMVEHEVDGVSLVSHLKSQGKTAVQRDGLLWHFPHYRGYNRVVPYSIIRLGDDKLIDWYEANRKDEFFDLKADPAESTNLIDSEPERVAKLRKRLAEMLADTNAKLPKPNPDFKKRPALGD